MSDHQKKPYLVLSGELGDGFQGHIIPMDDAGLNTLIESIKLWRDELGEGEGAMREEFTVGVVWYTDREVEELPEL